MECETLRRKAKTLVKSSAAYLAAFAVAVLASGAAMAQDDDGEVTVNNVIGYDPADVATDFASGTGPILGVIVLAAIALALIGWAIVKFRKFLRWA